MKGIASLLFVVCSLAAGQDPASQTNTLVETRDGPSLSETQAFIRSRVLRNGIVTYTDDKGAEVNQSIMGVVPFDCMVAFEVNTREITPKHSIVAASRTFEVDFSIIREIRLEKITGKDGPVALIRFIGRLSEHSLQQEETLRLAAEGEAVIKALNHLHALCGGGGTLFQ